MNRALARLEAGLTDRAGEPPAKVVREAKEVGLPEFLAESRVATLWGPGQFLILRRVDLYPGDLKVLTAYLDHPAPRVWMVFLAEGLKAREVEKIRSGGACPAGGGPGVLSPPGRGAVPVADSGGP